MVDECAQFLSTSYEGSLKERVSAVNEEIMPHFLG